MGTASDETNETIRLLEGDAGDEGVVRACEAVESWTKAGRWQDLVALAEALESRCEPGDKTRRGSFETVADHVEDQLALAAEDAAIDALLELSLRDRQRSVEVPRPRSLRIRAFASRLGYGQTPQAFLGALERARERAELHELLACWMHEVVLRGSSLANEARASRFREEALVKAGHPLAALPLELRPTEREAPSYMPLYGDKGLGRAIDTLASGPMSARTIPPPADGAAVRATRVDDPGVIDLMTAAVRPWAEGKSGKVEAKVFALDPQVSSSAVGSWLLRALPLESTAASARLDVSRIGPEGVFGPLFSAASNGGAYSSGLGGAYGRLAAWISLGALVGASEGAGVDAIAKLAASSTFLTFRTPGPWFHDVAWDLGVLVVREGGRSVAVLAATDTE
ncbi:MAG: hypothetical protein J0I07_04385 [Myxococcales bacterium]|nr:hypothetical protein [Myxococcales bacterium]